MTARQTMEEKKEQIAKLPQWAQILIRDLDRAREDSVRALDQFVDQETPSSVYHDDIVNTGDAAGGRFRRRYVQSERILFEHGGVRLRVALLSEGINLQWENVGGSIRPEIGLIPTGFQGAYIQRATK